MSENNYKYYSTQRPVDIGTFPKNEGGPVEIVNFDMRESVEYGLFRAWGCLVYNEPLTQKQMDDYELKAALGNPDRKRLEEQAQTIGKWEQAHRVPDVRRLTWWYSDFGVFVVKEFVTTEQLAERYDGIMEVKARAAQKRAAKKPITDQLKEAGRQAEHGDAPPVKKTFHNHEDR